jgi:hypothetical protein
MRTALASYIRHKETAVLCFDGGVLCGYVEAFPVTRTDVSSAAFDAALRLQQKIDVSREIAMYCVSSATLLKEQRGKGLGKKLYGELILSLSSYRPGELVMIGPSSAFGGRTSEMAQRVWASLRRGFLSEGPIVSSVPL